MWKELHRFFVVSVTVLKCDGDDRDGYDGFQKKKRRAHSPAIIGGSNNAWYDQDQTVLQLHYPLYNQFFFLKSKILNVWSWQIYSILTQWWCSLSKLDKIKRFVGKMSGLHGLNMVGVQYLYRSRKIVPSSCTSGAQSKKCDGDDKFYGMVSFPVFISGMSIVSLQITF